MLLLSMRLRLVLVGLTLSMLGATAGFFLGSNLGAAKPTSKETVPTLREIQGKWRHLLPPEAGNVSQPYEELVITPNSITTTSPLRGQRTITEMCRVIESCPVWFVIETKYHYGGKTYVNASHIEVVSGNEIIYEGDQYNRYVEGS